jgi:hypothetical protein
MVKANHHIPTMRRTNRRGRVDETFFFFDMRKRTKMLRIWTKTAAIYPMPTPLDEILEDSWSSVVVDLDTDGKARRSSLSSSSIESLSGDRDSKGIDEESWLERPPVTTKGWFATSSGRKALSRTKEDPRQVTPTTTRIAPRR